MGSSHLTLDHLAAQLGVSPDSLAALGVTRCGNAWHIPERNAEGEVIGYAKRFSHGRKGFVAGGHRGLTLSWPLDAYAGSSPDDPILVVEGMSDCAAGLTLGFTTIGRPSVTDGADPLSTLLKGRHVVVLGENDKSGAGQREAPKLARKLANVCASVRVVFPPGEIKDLRSWLNAPVGCTPDGLLAAILTSEPVELVDDEKEQEDQPDKPSQAEQLVRLALERYRMGRTDSNEAFAVEHAGPNVAIMFRGSRDALRSVLARELRRREGITPHASALADALTALQGEALDVSPEPLNLRTGQLDDMLVIDLGGADGKAVIVRPGEWEVVDRSPMLFRRTALTDALPIPLRGGDLKLLRELLNVTDEAWWLLLGFMIAAYIPSIPHPVLMLGGEQGTGKSCTARYIASVIDPTLAPLRSQPRDPEAWAMEAFGSWMIPVDNLSAIPAWLSDVLCKAVTGDAWVRRKLYSDSELSVLVFRRVVILTSIDAGVLRGDLGDRLLLIDLQRISDDRRRSETELDQLFAERRPLIFGALLDLLAETLTHLPNVTLSAMPRMADFARVLAAVDMAAGGDALPRYLSQRGRIAGDVVDSDPVAVAIVRLIDDCGTWSGTSGELLKRIRPDRQAKGWPANGQAMTGRLKRLMPALNNVGIEIAIPATRTRRGRIITISRKPTSGDDVTIADSHHATEGGIEQESTGEHAPSPSEGNPKRSSHLSPSSPSNSNVVETLLASDELQFLERNDHHPDHHTRNGPDEPEHGSCDDGDDLFLQPSDEAGMGFDGCPAIDPDDWATYAIGADGTWTDPEWPNTEDEEVLRELTQNG